MNKSKQSYKLPNLITINVGTMIGVGIFFKNAGILKTTNNIYIALAAWIIGAIIVYGLSLAFGEATSVTSRTGESGTLSNWMKIFFGKKAGRLTHMLMSFQYYPVFSVLLCYYAVIFTYSALQLTNINWLVTMGLTIALFALLSLGNALSYAFGKVFQMVGTVIKFIPLLAVVVLGFANPVVASSANTFSGTIGEGAATWNWASLVAALPSVFFAFDAFYGGLALSKEEEKRGDALKATVYSVILVAFFYVAFSAAIGWGTSDGDLFALFSKTVGANGAKILYFVIAISAYTVANGMMLAGTRQLKNTADDKAFLPINSIKSVTPDGRFAGQTALLFAIGTGYTLVLFIAAKLMGQDSVKLMDEFGNIVVLFAFAVYSLIALGVLANRFSGKIKTDKTKNLWLAVVAAIVTLGLIALNAIKHIIAGGITAYLILISTGVIFLLARITELGEGKIDK